MTADDRTRFLRVTKVLCGLALALAVVLSPPDPLTLLVYAGPLLLCAPVCSYVLTYGGGLEYLEAKL